MEGWTDDQKDRQVGRQMDIERQQTNTSDSFFNQNLACIKVAIYDLHSQPNCTCISMCDVVSSPFVCYCMCYCVLCKQLVILYVLTFWTPNYFLPNSCRRQINF